MKQTHATAGLAVTQPKTTCSDKKCPFHGGLKLRGRQFTGVLTSVTVHKSATLEFQRTLYNHKYERNEQRKTILHVHNPSCINAQEGDKVKVAECRRLSKTKKFVIINNLGKETGFKQKQELKEEGKFKRKEKVVETEQEQPAEEE